MAICPQCNERLVRGKRLGSAALECPICRGAALDLAVLRKTIPADVVEEMEFRAREDSAPSGPDCAVCNRPTVQVPIPMSRGTTVLDVCTACKHVWMPRSLGIPRPETIDEIAFKEFGLSAAKRPSEDFANKTPAVWKALPALLGMPVEADGGETHFWPWLTWAILAALAATYALTADNLKVVVRTYGLMPAQYARQDYLTFLTSFFLHGSLIHLIGNAYFLLLFGRYVEDALGRWRYAMLIAAAALAGDLTHIVCDPHGMLPCIGASGGISGVITYYALLCPKKRIGFLLFGTFRFQKVRLLFYRWGYMRAGVALAIWLGLQSVIAYHQMKGGGSVSGLAHLGGFGAGVIAMMIWPADGRSSE